MPELALDDEQRHPFPRHLDGMCVSKLVRCEPSPYPCSSGRVAEL